jgi:hypothetical protein
MLAAVLVALLGAAGCAATSPIGATPSADTPSFVSAADPTPATTGARATPPAPATAAAPSPGQTAATATAPPAGQRPASAAGGACRRLTFARVREVLGVEFQVAASGGAAATSQTCVLQQVAEPDSDLLLTVTPAPGVTARAFRDSYVPSGGVTLDGVGRAAYRVVVRAPGSPAPRVEIGWLSATGRVLTLARTLGVDEDPNFTGQVVDRLATLAADVDR